MTDGAAAPRALGFWSVVALVMGNMIGSGVFLLPSNLAPFGGGITLIGWGISTAGSLLLALVFARLARVRPAAGGPYAFTRAAFGDLAGFLVTWGYWISIWASLAALAVALVGYLHPFIPGIVDNPPSAAALAIALVWVLVLVNVGGVGWAGRVQVVTTVIKILPLAVVAFAGLAAFAPSRFGVPAAPLGEHAGNVMQVVTLTLWAFLGLESGTVPAGHVDRPNVTIPRATMVGTLAASAIYIVSTVGVMSVVAPEALATSTAPFADAARNLFGDWAGAAVAIGAAVSCFGALNGWTLTAGQVPMATAQDGLFPAVFARVSRRGTPAIGMIIAGVLATVLVQLNASRGLVELFKFIILLSTLGTLVPYLFCSLASLLLPEPAGAGGGRGGAVPAGATVVGILAFIYAIVAVGGAGMDVVYWGFLLLLAGLPVYVYLQRAASRAAGESAR
ncbi:MAG: amino acid permease [Vicinamibacterales bacterium]